ncbi:MAG: response regulator transcription factor [Myxococcota bacterium]|jgi:DNA-binding response OmpR family regulator|nr:response regulator transcription factor [Myxococcota bacterium]
MHVAVIEDDPLTRTMLRINLEHEGYKVTTCCSVEDWEQDPPSPAPDLVLLDHGLPGKTGIDLLVALRKDGHDTRVLVLTAQGSTALKVDALDLGADDYLTKPFHVRELLARVRALLRRGRTAVPVSGDESLES